MTPLRVAAAIAAAALILVCSAIAIRDIGRDNTDPWVFVSTAVVAGYGGGYLLRFAFTGALS